LAGGSGEPTGEDVGHIRNNDGDSGCLYDAVGRLVDTYVY
jgi:hypothetical protein